MPLIECARIAYIFERSLNLRVYRVNVSDREIKRVIACEVITRSSANIKSEETYPIGCQP